MKPQEGGYLISDIPEGVLIKRRLNGEGGGGLFRKSDDVDIYDSFSVLLHHILRIQQTIFCVKYMNSTQFYPKPSQSRHRKLV